MSVLIVLMIFGLYTDIMIIMFDGGRGLTVQAVVK